MTDTLKALREPRPHVCPHCDFGSGRRGMDRCSRCEETGSVFYVGQEMFPNTIEGYEAAVAALKSRSPQP